MKSILSVLVSFLSLNVFAGQSMNARVSSSYSSIRALGMGNAFTAVADDYSLIMYNPAGFARKKHNEFQLTLLGAGVSSKTLTIADEITKASDTAGTDSDKANAVSAVLEKYYGQSLGGKLQAFELFWIRNGWGVALLPMDLTIDMTVNKQLGPALDLNVRGDVTAAMGFGKEINKYIDAGVTFKYIHRISIEENVPAFELATDPNVLSDKRFREGTKFDFDLGMMWRPNWFNTSTTTIETPKTDAPAIMPEEPKKEESKLEVKPESATEEKQAEDKKIEEERKPQSEGDSAEIKVAEADSKDAKEAKDANAVADKPAEGPAAPAEAAAAAAKTEEPETQTKTVETAVSESDERFPLTFGVVVHNVIGGEFSLAKDANKSATEVPSKLNRVIDLGSQYLLRDGEDFKIRAMLDFHNLLHPEITLNKATHIGLEFDYSPNTWFKTQLRAGMNQMYFTAGASFLFGIINLDVATYGEEIGTADAKLENRVMAAKLGFNF